MVRSEYCPVSASDISSVGEEVALNPKYSAISPATSKTTAIVLFWLISLFLKKGSVCSLLQEYQKGARLI